MPLANAHRSAPQEKNPLATRKPDHAASRTASRRANKQKSKPRPRKRSTLPLGLSQAETILLHLDVLVPALARHGSRMGSREYGSELEELRASDDLLESTNLAQRLAEIRRILSDLYDKHATKRRAAAFIRQIDALPNWTYSRKRYARQVVTRIKKDKQAAEWSARNGYKGPSGPAAEDYWDLRSLGISAPS